LSIGQVKKAYTSLLGGLHGGHTLSSELIE
jgi:hypothetical protein